MSTAMNFVVNPESIAVDSESMEDRLGVGEEDLVVGEAGLEARKSATEILASMAMAFVLDWVVSGGGEKAIAETQKSRAECARTGR